MRAWRSVVMRRAACSRVRARAPNRSRLRRRPAPSHPAWDPVREEVHRRAVDEERKARDRLPGQADAVTRPGPLEPSSYRFVLDVVFGQEGPVALDALPDPLDPRRIAPLEVIGRIHDGP